MLLKPFSTLSNCAHAGETEAASNTATKIGVNLDMLPPNEGKKMPTNQTLDGWHLEHEPAKMGSAKL
jgi:hypothetical protein